MGVEEATPLFTCRYSLTTRLFRYFIIPGLAFFVALFGFAFYGAPLDWSAFRIPILLQVVALLVFGIGDIIEPQVIRSEPKRMVVSWWFRQSVILNFSEVRVIGPVLTHAVFLNPRRRFWVRSNMENLDLLVKLIREVQNS